MIVDTIRPNAVQSGGTGWTAVPSGTLNGTTSDDSDSTYARSPTGSDGLWLGYPTHTPTAGYQRHQARHRVRLASNDSGSTTLIIDLDRPGGPDAANSSWVRSGTSPTTFTSPYSSDPLLNLAQAAALALQTGMVRSAGSQARVVEVYVDIDTRAKPSFVADVLDAQGASQGGGIITVSNIAQFVWNTLDYDGLNARTWTLEVRTDPGGVLVHSDSGVGVPSPGPVVLTNGDYIATLQVSSTIRIDDEYLSDEETVAFTMAATLPGGPTNLTATPTADPPSIEVCWEAPAETPEWVDLTQVYAEVTRTDCNGTQRIALIPDGLTACWTDRFASLSTLGVFCGEEDHTCQICYEVRYWGYVDAIGEPITTAIPSGVILAWPDTVGTIPSNWSRVTALDGRYPRGVPTAATNPGTTGGASTHTHTTPGHVHSQNHSHTQPALGNSTTFATAGPGSSVAEREHNHTRPTTSTATINSGSASPAASAASSEQSRKEVIFVQSNGVPTQVPAGMMALAHILTPPADWESEGSDGASASSRPPYLKGAAAAGPGSLDFTEVLSHNHAIATHTHGATSHGHTSANSGQASAESGTGNLSDPDPLADDNHTHPITITNASTASLAANGGGTSGLGDDDTTEDLAFRYTNFLRATALADQFVGLIGLWQGTLASIPSGWLLCDGNNGTPDFLGRHPRYHGPFSINVTGGGSSHGHTTPSHSDHVAGVHDHASSEGSATPTITERGIISVSPSAESTPQVHAHANADTNTATPTVGAGGSGVTSSDALNPPFIETAFIMLAEGATTPLDAPVLVVTESESICVDSLPNPTPGNSWIHGAVSGDLSICDSETYGTFRPFGPTQSIGGGIPTVITGDPSGRNYSLRALVTSEAELVAFENIVYQQLFFFQPASGAADVWLAPNQTSVNVLKIGRVREIVVDTIAVNPQPVADPQIAIPLPAASPGS